MPVPHYADDLVKLHLGDCLDIMAAMSDASVDAIVTDPPYGLEFMGREWDSFKPSAARIRQSSARDKKPGVAHNASTSLVTRNVPDAYVAGQPFQRWCEAWARECLRVLKPGGYLLAFGGTRTYHRLTCGIEDAGFEIRDSLHWIYGQGFPKGKGCLKPSHEPIVMARKPDKRSAPLAGLNACRVGATEALVRPHILRDDNEVYGHGLGAGVQSEPAGRWPPNILLTHSADCNGSCAPGCPVAEMDAQSGVTRGNAGIKKRAGSVNGNGAWADESDGSTVARPRIDIEGGYPDSGGASRFFPCFRYQAKAPKSERPRLPDGTAWPTVKPLELMRWLVRLVTPPGGTVLDPFAGSGTTGQACALEGFQCVLIERDPVAAELTLERLRKPAQQQMTLDIPA